MQGGREKSGSAEKNGDPVGRVVLQELLDGKSLSQQSHGEPVGGVAESVREGFPEGLGKVVERGGLLKAGSLELKAVPRRLLEQDVQVTLRHFGEWSEAKPGAGKGLGEARASQSRVDLGRGENNPRDFAIGGGAGKKRGAGVVQDHMKDDIVEMGIFPMSVEFPVAGFEVDFDGTVERLVVDRDGGFDKVGTGPSVPFAGRNDGDVLTVIGPVSAGKVSGEPTGLNLDFVEGRGSIFSENSRWGGSELKDSLVGHKAIFSAGWRVVGVDRG
jgi:hypothetical protein